MKTINTLLTEEQFLRRLKQNTTEKTRFNRGYEDFDTLVFKMKKNNFWIGKHYANGGKSEYANERLNCRYELDDTGRVAVKYKRGVHPVAFFGNLLVLVFGICSAYSSVSEILAGNEIDFFGRIFLPVVLLAISIFNLFFRTKKEWISQEEHLAHICKNDVEEIFQCNSSQN